MLANNQHITKSTFYPSNRSLSTTHFQIWTLKVNDSVHLKDSLLVYLPHRWKASSSVRDTSSFASSSELRSSKQVSNWASRWRSISRAEVDWDVIEDVLSERTRGTSDVSDIFLLFFQYNWKSKACSMQTKSSSEVRRFILWFSILLVAFS